MYRAKARILHWMRERSKRKKEKEKVHRSNSSINLNRCTPMMIVIMKNLSRMSLNKQQLRRPRTLLFPKFSHILKCQEFSTQVFFNSNLILYRTELLLTHQRRIPLLALVDWEQLLFWHHLDCSEVESAIEWWCICGLTFQRLRGGGGGVKWRSD